MGVVVIHAHPYPRRSRAGRALLRALDGLDGLEVRSLYDRYPDFAIDVRAEQDALRNASAVVWQTPFYWYGVPSLLSHWFEKVLAHGFAHAGPASDTGLTLSSLRPPFVCVLTLMLWRSEGAFVPFGPHPPQKPFRHDCVPTAHVRTLLSSLTI